MWAVIAMNASWVLMECAMGGRETLGIMDNVIPPIMCIPLVVELSLRFIYEPGHTGTAWSPAERDKKRGPFQSLAWHRLRSCLCPCFVVHCCDSLETMLELALCRTPLVAVDSVAVCSYILDRWVLLGASLPGPRAPMVKGYIHAFSSAMQLVRLLRPWAVGTKEQNWPAACTGGTAGRQLATWLTTDTGQLVGADGEEGSDLERQHMASKAETIRPPGMFSGSAPPHGW